MAGGETIAATGREVLGASARENTDATLVADARQGGVGSFGELVQRHQRAVYGIVSRMVTNKDDVDDIVQEIFVAAYRSLGAFKGEAAFPTWLYRIAVNTTIKQMRKLKVRQAASLDDSANGLSDGLSSSPGDGPDRKAEKAERDSAVRRAIETLPEKHRAVVALHYFQDLSCDQIAGVMDCSVGTVWSRLHYACKKLRGQLDWLIADGG